MENTDREICIYMKDEVLSLEIIIPEKFLGSFFTEFGHEFATDTVDGGPDPKRVNDYFFQGTGWHVIVNVYLFQEKKLYEFISNFCEKRKLTFRNEE